MRLVCSLVERDVEENKQKPRDSVPNGFPYGFWFDLAAALSQPGLPRERHDGAQGRPEGDRLARETFVQPARKDEGVRGTSGKRANRMDNTAFVSAEIVRFGNV